MKILKWNSYENSKVKFKLNLKFTQIHGKGFTKIIIWTSLQILWILQHCLLSGNDAIFRTRGPGSSRTFELHYLAISRQVHSCSCPLTYFEQTTFSKYYFITCIKSKSVFINEIELLWWAMESWLFCTIGVSWGGDSIVPGKIYRI